MLSISLVLNRAVQINATGIATIMGERRRTWQELRERVSRLAAGLLSLGVTPQDRVAILALNSDRYFEYYLAVPWAGATFVPINTRLAPAEVVYWLGDSESNVLFVDDTFLELIDGIRDQLPHVRHYVYIGDGPVPAGMHSHDELIAGHDAIASAEVGDEDIAGLYYTGGTTGRSKGVMLSHTGLIINVIQMLSVVPQNVGDRYIQAAPLFHMAGGALLMQMLQTAGCGIFLPAFEPVRVMDLIQSHRVNRALLVPTMINMIVNHPDVGDYDLSSLETLLYGASPMPEALVLKAMEVMPGTAFYQLYGQTEASPVLTCLQPEYHVAGSEKLKSAGRPLPGIEVRILDDDDNEVAPGTVGEVCARGPMVMPGYRNMAEQTAAALRGGWLHTGDGGYMDEEGFVYIVDRVKDMIVSGGENVYSAEVENALHQHAAVVECAVIGIPHEQWGEQVHAIVRRHDGQDVDEAGLIVFCHELIAGYKCPRSISFTEQPLPLSGAGKILKRELRAPYWEGRGRSVN